MMYFTFIFLSRRPGIPRILRRCLALEREYCVNFEPYINDELSELVKTYGYRIEVPANTYYIKPGQKLTEITYIASGSTSHSMFGLTGQEKISYILSAGWFLTESLFANEKMFSIAERYTSALTDLVLYKIDANAYNILIEKKVFRDAIIRSLSNKRAFLQRELESVTLECVKERLKNFFVLLSDPASSKDRTWYPLSHYYTHQEIASIIGTNRVTVSRLISELAREDFLRVINKRVELNSIHITD